MADNHELSKTPGAFMDEENGNYEFLDIFLVYNFSGMEGFF